MKILLHPIEIQSSDEDDYGCCCCYYRFGLGREGRQCCCCCWPPVPPLPPPPHDDRETGRARMFGGSVQVMFACGHRDSFDGTQIVGPLWDQITFFTLL